jgi:aldose 1-epimerase
MARTIRIETGDIAVDVMPELGGSLGGFDVKAGERRLPVLRRWSGESESPRTFSSIPMTPWWARISGGGFTFDGTFYPIANNDPEDTHPLHGDGWQSPWSVIDEALDHVALRLTSRAIPPFEYEANLVYAVSGPALEARLSIRNQADRRLPYGFGLHPWFTRTPDVMLQFRATGTWLPQPPHLPTRAAPDPLPPEWDFSEMRRLPPDFIDNSFAGWDGRGRIEWPDQGYAVDVQADPGIRISHVYAPGPQFPFFCFEQVSTVIDALNLPDPPQETGLRILGPGEETSMWARYTARRL